MKEIRENLPQGLYLFDLSQPKDGYYCFISSWFFVDPSGCRVLVDPGPPGTIPALLEKLSAVTDGVDLVLLTHIHLDHSGGIGQLCDRYGGAQVLAHPKAGKYLVSPEKLWKATVSTLGDVAAMYGEPKPLAPEKLIDCRRACEMLSGLEVMETPGHAPHHLTFFAPLNGQRLVFAGELLGLRLPEELGTRYLRPATPPRFDYPAEQESLAKIESAVRDDDLLCYGHWGLERSSRASIEAAKRQLDEWLDVAAKMENSPVGEIMKHLLANDPFLAGYSSLPEDMRSRERFFMENSIIGLLEYVKSTH